MMRNEDSRNRRHGEKGTTIAELAIVMPLFLLLTLGAFELGRGVWVKHTLTHVAREAARYAAVRSSTSDDPLTAKMVEDRVKSEALGIDTDALSVATVWNPSNVVGATVEIQISYDFEPATPLLPFDSITLESHSQRVIAY